VQVPGIGDISSTIQLKFIGWHSLVLIVDLPMIQPHTLKLKPVVKDSAIKRRELRRGPCVFKHQFPKDAPFVRPDSKADWKDCLQLEHGILTLHLKRTSFIQKNAPYNEKKLPLLTEPETKKNEETKI